LAITLVAVVQKWLISNGFDANKTACVQDININIASRPQPTRRTSWKL